MNHLSLWVINPSGNVSFKDVSGWIIIKWVIEIGHIGNILSYSSKNLESLFEQIMTQNISVCASMVCVMQENKKYLNESKLVLYPRQKTEDCS